MRQPGPLQGSGLSRFRFRSLVAASVGVLAVGAALVLLRPSGRAPATGGVLQAVAVAVQFRQVDMVGEPIQQGTSEALGLEHRWPFFKWQVGCLMVEPRS